MEFTRFTWGMIGTLLGGGWWLSQMAVSFPIVRGGCILLIIAGLLGIGIDAAIDKAKIDAEVGGAELLTVITPHIGFAIGLLFMVLIGIFVGWGW